MPDLDIDPPYIAVIFTSRLKIGAEKDGYEKAGEHMAELAKEQPGYLGMHSARRDDGYGITISYWTDEASIKAWGAHPEHMKAIAQGKNDWYEDYRIRFARVE